MSNILTATATEASRLDKFLASQFAEISRARFQKLIADGCVSVEGETADDMSLKLKPGQEVVVEVPEAAPAEPQAENISLDVIFEDKDLIVINKPAGLVVHPGAGNETGTLVNALIAHCGDSLSGIGGVKRPGIVHRIDKETSGLLVVAKNDKAHASLSEQFAAHGRDGRMEREYLALVWGKLDRKSGTVSTGLARSSANRQKMAVSNSESAKEAITHYDVVQAFAAASLIRCHLETGRTHQIRVHMAHLGHPLLGDGTYGSGFAASKSKLPKPAQDALSHLRGQALHATVLGFDHPRTGKHLRFEAPLPPVMAALLLALKAA
ncbi:RluA family pseudouridine synthase [Aestuariivirga litoralis]|uniref:RluA family pseudouridine synthase n=1 Tax=Aestuariivirga litoralis TaxID=2650924 RepID=UPI0018C66C05|nr:RluA family pseudouridine synthase [Aestuariivirga litoralis]MBG1230889.1 RluA family pseudouridine synthase [Aestuariivirga litoralis]